jgi:hypothetical protein
MAFSGLRTGQQRKLLHSIHREATGNDFARLRQSAFPRTVLREAERPQRKLFEPGGRVVAAAVQQALEPSESAFEPAKSFLGAGRYSPFPAM